MKKIIYSLLVLWVMSSCSTEDSFIDTTKNDNAVRIKFELNIAGEQSATTRASNKMDLHLFVFDQNGMGVKHEVMTYQNQLTLSLPKSNEKAILHFVWAEEGFEKDVERSFSYDEFIGMHEGEAINLISSSRELYWERVETPPLVSNTNLGKIVLLRNMARVSVKNSTPSKNRFDILGFAIHNVPATGTVAPFNCSSNKFERDVITEAYPKQLIPLAPCDASGRLLIPESQVVFQPENQNINVFERQKSSSSEPFYLIIKAKYKHREYFYKLGFYNNENSERIGLKRNVHYVININNVEKAGYDRLEDAMANPPADNAGLSVLLEEYSQISDGRSSLSVSSTALSFHNKNEEVYIEYKYKSNNKTADLKPSIELLQDNEHFVIKPWTFDYTHSYDRSSREHTGVISGMTSDLMPLKGNYTGVVRVRMGDLVRDIRLELGAKKELDARIVSLGDRVDDNVYIEFKIDQRDILNNSILPIKFDIDANYLYPNTEYGYNSQLSIIHVDGSTHYHYQYNANEVGVHRIYFKRNLSYKSEVVQIKSDHYQTKELLLVGSDQVLPHVAHGEIYVEASRITKLPKDAQVYVDPEDMPRSFWMPKDGVFNFQFDKRRTQSNDKLNITAHLKDGSVYKADYRFSHFLDETPVIYLSSYNVASLVYAYYNGTSQVLDMRAFYITSSHPDVDAKLNTDDIYRVNALDISFKSSLSDDQEITFYASYKSGWEGVLYKAITTVGKLRRNQALDFAYAR